MAVIGSVNTLTCNVVQCVILGTLAYAPAKYQHQIMATASTYPYKPYTLYCRQVDSYSKSSLR